MIFQHYLQFTFNTQIRHYKIIRIILIFTFFLYFVINCIGLHYIPKQMLLNLI